MWREHFNNLLEDSLKVTDKPITKIINSQLDIKLKQFTQEFNAVLTKTKSRKATDHDEIPSKVWNTRKFDDLLLRFCNAIYTQDTIERLTNSCILPFPKKGNLGITKNYRVRNLTSIGAKVYKVLLNRIEPEIVKILLKNQNSFRRNWSTTSQILRIHRIIGADTGCSLEDFREGWMIGTNRERGRERFREIHASGESWWWWSKMIRFSYSF